MIENILRVGNFTSSSIADLMSNGRRDMTEAEIAQQKRDNPKSKAKTILAGLGAPALSYIKAKNQERRAGRSVDKEISARALSWGKICEGVAGILLGDDYVINSQETISHPTIPYWKGSPDGENDKTDTLSEIKCPDSLGSFFTFADCKDIAEVREEHKDGEKYFWQCVSNAIITGRKYAELVIYCPYKRELDIIREAASNYDGPNQKQFEWIALYAEDTQLPYLIEGKHYKHMYIFRWEISKEDKDALTERVIEAGKLLVQIEQEKVVYKPTIEQIELAKAKIELMKELKKRLSGNYSNVQ